MSRKKSVEDKDYYENQLNEVVHFAEPEEVSGTLRKVVLVYNFASEVINGGYGQYFCNKAEYDHVEVIAALKYLGFEEHANLLKKGLEIHEKLEALEENKETDGEEFNDLAEKEEELSGKHFDLSDLMIAIYDQTYKEKESELVEWVE